MLNVLLLILVLIGLPLALGAVRLLTFLEAARAGAFSDPIGRGLDRWLVVGRRREAGK